MTEEHQIDLNTTFQCLKQAKEKLKEQKKALKTILLEDPEYAEFSEDVKACNEVMKAKAQAIIKDDPQASKAQNMIDNAKEDIKDFKKVMQAEITARFAEQLSMFDDKDFAVSLNLDFVPR